MLFISERREKREEKREERREERRRSMGEHISTHQIPNGNNIVRSWVYLHPCKIHPSNLVPKNSIILAKAYEINRGSKE
jgi:hypothetical protein